MKPETPFHAPAQRRDAATAIATPQPVQDGIGAALKAAYPATHDETARDLSRLLERLY